MISDGEGPIKSRYYMDVENSRPRRFGLLLVTGFSHLAMAMVIEPLFIANWIAQRKLCSWSTLSADGLAVTASSGIHAPVDFPLGTTEHFDVVLVAASFGTREAATDARVLKWLRWAERAGTEVGAIETGSEILAAAGMMDGETAPVHWYNVEGMRERYPDVNVTDTLYSLSSRRPVSAGASATLDMMIALIARMAGQELSDEVAQHLLLQRRQGTDRQKTSHDKNESEARDPVSRARQIMGSTIDEPKSCDAIAKMVGISERHLQRLFQQQLGAGMAEIYHMLRMERAHQLVQLTDLNITQIAMACGFSSLEVFSRNYKKAFGVPPSRDRRQSIDSGITINKLNGSDLTEAVWDDFFAFYIDTGSRKWGRPYLTRAFFSMIGQDMADRILLVMAKRDGRYIAGAINFIGAGALFGRHWGAIEHHPFLHFELCYYQAIDFAIANKLATVEAGAQGEHKLARGYAPVTTYSSHYIADPGLRRAIADYLKRERAYVDAAGRELEQLTPFRKMAEQE